MIKKAISSLLIVASFLMLPVPAFAVVDPFDNCATGVVTDSSVCKAANGGKLFGPDSIWNRILNTLTYVIGAIAVLMIIVAAVRYAVSSGDQATVSSAKNTIIYALVALIIAVMANALVNFVLTNI